MKKTLNLALLFEDFSQKQEQENKNHKNQNKNHKNQNKNQNKHKEDITKHIPFAVQYVNKIINRNPHLYEIKDDLLSAAFEGLVKAREIYDKSKGTTFLTIAGHYIKKEVFIQIKQRHQKIYTPMHIINLNSKIERFKKQFETENERPPTKKEIAKKVKITEKKLKKLEKETPKVISLEQPIGKDDKGRDIPLHETIGVNPIEQLEEELDREKLRKILTEALSKLPKREAIIISYRYGLNGEKLTLKEIAKILDMSPERIRQIEIKAIKKLKLYLIDKKQQILEIIL